jgi:hypothetical protein
VIFPLLFEILVESGMEMVGFLVTEIFFEVWQDIIEKIVRTKMKFDFIREIKISGLNTIHASFMLKMALGL